MFRFVAIVTILIASFAILFGIIENVQYTDSPRPNNLGKIQDRSPLETNEFGRFTKPLSVVDYSWTLSSKTLNFITLKHWDFKSISTKDYFIGVAIANVNYMGTAFVYAVDRTKKEKQFYQYASKSILAGAIQEQAKSSIDGCTIFNKSSTEYLSSCYNGKDKRYDVSANVPINSNIRLSFEFQIKFSSDKDQSLVLVYPVKETHPVYSHKIAGLPAQGKIKINNYENALTDGISSVDWTFGYPARICRWKWASLSVMVSDSTNNEQISIGINLSDLVYIDNNGISMENAIWIAGQVYTVDKIIYELPETQYQTSKPWQIYSAETTNSEMPKLRLSFQPWGSQNEQMNAFIVAVDFVQAFGVYNGTIEIFDRIYVIENAFGVAENHYSKW